MTTPTLNLGKPRPSLTPAQRFELAGASVKNAIDLRGDARLLAEADRPQHAAFLLVACVEELVKAQLLIRAHAHGPSPCRSFAYPQEAQESPLPGRVTDAPRGLKRT